MRSLAAHVHFAVQTDCWITCITLNWALGRATGIRRKHGPPRGGCTSSGDVPRMCAMRRSYGVTRADPEPPWFYEIFNEERVPALRRIAEKALHHVRDTGANAPRRPSR